MVGMVDDHWGFSERRMIPIRQAPIECWGGMKSDLNFNFGQGVIRFLRIRDWDWIISLFFVMFGMSLACLWQFLPEEESTSRNFTLFFRRIEYSAGEKSWTLEFSSMHSDPIGQSFFDWKARWAPSGSCAWRIGKGKILCDMLDIYMFDRLKIIGKSEEHCDFCHSFTVIRHFSHVRMCRSRSRCGWQFGEAGIPVGNAMRRCAPMSLLGVAWWVLRRTTRACRRFEFRKDTVKKNAMLPWREGTKQKTDFRTLLLWSVN